MKIFSIFLLSAAAAAVAADDGFRLWGRITFERPETQLVSNGYSIPMPPTPGNEDAKSYLALRLYPRGRRSRLYPMRFDGANAFGGAGRSGAFDIPVSNEVLLLVDHVGEIRSVPGLYAAFCLYVPPDSGTSFAVGAWNYTRKKSAIQAIRVTPGRWNVVKVPLNLPGKIDDGDLIKGFSICGRNAGKPQRWQVDNIVVWQGRDPESPTQVKGVEAREEADMVKLRWSPASDNLFVAKYRVYRGTVKNFPRNAETLVGESTTPEFVDRGAMRDDYFYSVTAMDCAGTEGAPSVPVRMVPAAGK